jgi:hypothetical protein
MCSHPPNDCKRVHITNSQRRHHKPSLTLRGHYLPLRNARVMNVSVTCQACVRAAAKHSQHTASKQKGLDPDSLCCQTSRHTVRLNSNTICPIKECPCINAYNCAVLQGFSFGENGSTHSYFWKETTYIYMLCTPEFLATSDNQ